MTTDVPTNRAFLVSKDRSYCDELRCRAKLFCAGTHTPSLVHLKF